MRVILLCAKAALVVSIAAWVAATCPAQTRPPTINSVEPYGAQRGTTVKLTVAGANLADASLALFDDPGLSGKVVNITDLGVDKIERKGFSTAPPIEDRARNYRVTLEVNIAPQTPTGRHSVRIKTPLGTTNLGSFFVGALPEVSEAEPNNSLAAAQKLTLPATVSGHIGSADDTDYYGFDAKAGEQVVFEVVASALRSSLDSTLTLYDAKGRALARNEDYNGRPDSVLAYTFAERGSFVIAISDGLNGGSKRHFYRLSVGNLPYLTSVFPLGMPKATAGEVAVTGFNLGGADKVKVTTPDRTDTITLPPPATKDEPLNKMRLAVGRFNEVAEREPNDSIIGAQAITFPVTINGRIEKVNANERDKAVEKDEAGADEDLYRFSAKRGQKVVFTVAAQRLGSPLDSVVEVLDSTGREVRRATLRPVFQTSITLRDHDSTGQGIRLDSWTGLAVGDPVLIGNELTQVAQLPAHPDADVIFKNYRGRRVALEDTTTEAHALGSSVYKVEVREAGASFPPNGMPVVNLTYRNDDGGPSYGKDSRLTFTAPADGDYFLRIRDVLGRSGKLFAYRLSASAPAPDYTLTVTPSNPNVPRGGRIPVTVIANRIDGFDGRIDVEVMNLPKGVQATGAAILPGSDSVALTLAASDDADAAEAATLRVAGRAIIDGKEVTRQAFADEQVSVVAVASPPDLYVAAVEPESLEIEAGGQAKLSVKIKRANGFEGRVPVSVENLPVLFTVPDIGLNGILITEKEESRTFTIVADPRAEPGEQTLLVTARIETNSANPVFASMPVRLKVLPRQARASR